MFNVKIRSFNTRRHGKYSSDNTNILNRLFISSRSQNVWQINEKSFQNNRRFCMHPFEINQIVCCARIWTVRKPLNQVMLGIAIRYGLSNIE